MRLNLQHHHSSTTSSNRVIDFTKWNSGESYITSEPVHWESQPFDSNKLMRTIKMSILKDSKPPELPKLFL